MKYSESTFDMLKTREDCYLAHFIPANFELKTNIAQRLSVSADLYKRLVTKYPDYLTFFKNSNVIGDCLDTGNIFNLVVTETSDDIATCSTISVALEKLKRLCIEKRIKKLAISFVGLKISSNDIRFSTSINNEERIMTIKFTIANLIKYTFNDTTIEITNFI